VRLKDCGAGIGRVAENVLMPLFEVVDQVEQSPSHVAAAQQRLKAHPKSGEFYCEGLQKFTPRVNFYDCVWVQWVVGYLTDDDLRSFLQR
jgi:protein N-terminal methyltransferase